ncbi:hypothetical protein [Dapis sp. BLCC M229]|uniref:hypothetical protein n=1 Tax=Dapis sp. BLCC M229 TaxID=3400188 RepID=UPI003CEE6588
MQQSHFEYEKILNIGIAELRYESKFIGNREQGTLNWEQSILTSSSNNPKLSNHTVFQQRLNILSEKD